MKRNIYYRGYARILVFMTLCAVVVTPLSAREENPAPGELIQMADEVSERASRMAIKAKETKDYYQAQYSFALVSEVVPWVFEVLGMAKETSNAQLAKAAQNAVENISTAIVLARDAAVEVAADNHDPEVAHAVGFLLESCEMLLDHLRMSTK